ncbi:DUF4115 domain-containing protein [Sphingobium sufflavum]|uniref:helix-turn-helix domain-containing protein n=1 Tax=Sphingobium sufflavum TaxID=1129547 RepID=UPI001F2F3192|nr:helix-turn-helix domain-containing protein [Sphingobium sufflavum]MCE7798763.1 DUF4115 domain-containing protein [Sphingobium sufflavum]
MDSETEGQPHEAVATVTASAQMRAAREAAGLPLEEVAARTRVPLRHLEALERGDFAALPGITYCAGFARAYARAVGLDEKALVAKVREEIDTAGDFSAADAYQIDEPTDPARVPPRSLAWVAAIAGLMLVSGYGLWRMQINTPPGEEALTEAPVVAPRGVPQAQPAPQPVTTGPVVLTAVEDVWLRIYDADGKSLLIKTLTKGESFTVPADANNPMILTGRPDALAVTVGGRAIPPLGTAERTISDVPISAAALLARGVAPAATPAAVPATTAPATGQPTAATAPQTGQARPAQPGAVQGQAARAPAAATTARPATGAGQTVGQSARPQPAARPQPSSRPATPARTETRSAPAPAASATPPGVTPTPAPAPASPSSGDAPGQ